MFGTLGGPEIILILVIALIVFGPRKLPEIGKTVGKMLAEFRKASTDFKRTIEDEVEAENTALPPAAPPPMVAADGTVVPEVSSPAPDLQVSPPDAPTVSRGSDVLEPPPPMETPSRLEPPALPDDADAAGTEAAGPGASAGRAAGASAEQPVEPKPA
jgi:TatA/E family protein of Tat protein translocase